ncbi:hypothetical protein AUQ37_01045 [Candidatus Methanomethylophilus sp. 1R26]|nr:hypothetical protein [Candidatus Methanomethylophilus sp. 1R26]KUE73925.1 hypothetical protein AUQ37_01045 [Candidatus Methanomethylophilus sp. 1R26]TQS76767.1 MAG: hypothetical protein A3Q59_02525 [Methanomethylophilus alvi]
MHAAAYAASFATPQSRVSLEDILERLRTCSMQEPSFLSPLNGMKMQNTLRTHTISSLCSAIDGSVVNTPISGSARMNTAADRATVMAIEVLAEYEMPSFILGMSPWPSAAEHTGIIAAPIASDTAAMRVQYLNGTLYIMTATVPPAMMMKTLWIMLVMLMTVASVVLGPAIPMSSDIAALSGRYPLKDILTFIDPPMYQYRPIRVEARAPIDVAHPAPEMPIPAQ